MFRDSRIHANYLSVGQVIMYMGKRYEIQGYKRMVRLNGKTLYFVKDIETGEETTIKLFALPAE